MDAETFLNALKGICTSNECETCVYGKFELFGTECIASPAYKIDPQELIKITEEAISEQR